MSRLDTIKAQMMEIAKQLNDMAQAMHSCSQNLTQQVAAVSSAIGGTASNEDTQLVASIQLAKNSVDAAANQLLDASQKAKDWASKA